MVNSGQESMSFMPSSIHLHPWWTQDRNQCHLCPLTFICTHGELRTGINVIYALWCSSAPMVNSGQKSMSFMPSSIHLHRWSTQNRNQCHLCPLAFICTHGKLRTGINVIYAREHSSASMVNSGQESMSFMPSSIHLHPWWTQDRN